MRRAEMQQLGDLSEAELAGDGSESEVLEGRGDGFHEPEHFAERNGFDPAFLGRFQVPLPANGNASDEVQLEDGSGSELRYRNFSIVMSKSRRLAFYVACTIDGRLSRKTKRKGSRWFYDLRIPEEYQVGNEAYVANKLDRGHLVRREDPIWGPQARQANDDSFHYTNCAPQHAILNQQIWLGLENYILENARDNDLRVLVFTGPVFREDDRVYRRNEDEPVEVQLPRQYWKVVCTRVGDRLSSTAYILSQANLIKGDLEEAFEYGPYRTYQVSIVKIEKLTGLDFGSLRDVDGFSGEEEATREEQFEEIVQWESIRI